MNLYKCLIVSFCLVCPFLGWTQNIKVEIEREINRDAVPEEIIEKAEDILKDSGKITYYQEENEEKITYELKTEWRGRKLSIEFYSNGQLMDIEELIDLNDIDENPRKEIERYFDKNLDKHKITRVQRQYNGEEDEDDDEEVIEDFIENDLDDLIIKYEIVAYVKSDDKFGPYEFLFDKEGRILDIQKISHRSSDNVLYK